jgi:acetyl-CoA C-acetyltransferase
MSRVYIVAAKRTAIGSFGGSFKNVPAAKLAAEAIKAVVSDTGVDPGEIDEVIVGNVINNGQGMGPAARRRSMRAYPITSLHTASTFSAEAE